MGKTLLTILLAISVVFSWVEKTQASACYDVFMAKKDPKKSYQKLNAFFKEAGDRIMERDYVLELAKVALIAKEGFLMLGPPGTAKSLVVHTIFENIYSEVEKAPSYFRLQMTPETTFSETHGPLDFKKLQDSGEQKRILDQGMILYKNVFLDEIFDARSNALRNVLGAFAERAHAQGPEITYGEIETFAAATNRYISEVYQKTGDDSPKAVIDRFAFNVFIPKLFEKVDATEKIIQRAGKKAGPMPELTFEDLDVMRDMVQDVEIPSHVAKFMTLLRRDFMVVTEGMEQNSLRAYDEKLRNGEDPPPPYRATKYLSDRTVDKAAKVLKAMVVLKHLESDGQKPLRATIEDVRSLEMFFTLNGPKTDFLMQLSKISSNPHEKMQIETILQERKMFTQIFDQLHKGVNENIARFGIEMASSVKTDELSQSQVHELVAKLTSTLVVLENTGLEGVDTQLGLKAEHISAIMVKAYAEERLAELIGNEKTEEIIAQARIQYQAEQKKLEEQRELAEAEIRRQQEEAERLELQRLEELEHFKSQFENAKAIDSLEADSKLNHLNIVEAGGEKFIIDALGAQVYHQSKDGKVSLIQEKYSSNLDLIEVASGSFGTKDSVFEMGGRLVFFTGSKFAVFNPANPNSLEHIGLFSMTDNVRAFLKIDDKHILAEGRDATEHLLINIETAQSKKIDFKYEAVGKADSDLNSERLHGLVTNKVFDKHAVRKGNSIFMAYDEKIIQMDLASGVVRYKEFKNLQEMKASGEGKVRFFTKYQKEITIYEVELNEALKPVEVFKIEDADKLTGATISTIENIRYLDNENVIALMTGVGLYLVDAKSGELLVGKAFFAIQEEVFDILKIKDGQYISVGEIDNKRSINTINLED